MAEAGGPFPVLPPRQSSQRVRYRARRADEDRVGWTIKPPRSLATAIDALAAASGMSRNAYVEDLLRYAAGRGWVREREGEPSFREGGEEAGD